MKYVALLRGINVGGNNKISMAELKTVFEYADLKNVITYINSGNVLFESSEKNYKELSSNLEKLVEKKLNVTVRILIKSEPEIKQVLENIPNEWKSKNNLRCYIAFLFNSLKAKDAVKEIQLKEGVDSLKEGPEVLFLTTDMKQLTKSAFNKLASKKIYKDMTIRNLNTTKKIMELFNR